MIQICGKKIFETIKGLFCSGASSNIFLAKPNQFYSQESLEKKLSYWFPFFYCLRQSLRLELNAASDANTLKFIERDVKSLSLLLRDLEEVKKAER